MTHDAWLPDLGRARGVKYQLIADALERAVTRGVVRGGDRLPPQRELAARLNVDLTTVTKAFDVARRRGLIEPRGRLGSFVREPGATPFTDLPQVDTAMNMPPELPEGVLGRAIADGTTALLRHGSGARLQYQPPGGALQDRAAGARLLERLCAPTLPEQVVIAAGGQNALHAILAAGLAPGDTILCGAYVYSGLKALAARAGLRLCSVADWDRASVEDAIARHRPQAIYLVPTNDNPTARTLTLAERRTIAGLVRAHEVQLIEDDAYGALAADRLPPVSSFVADRSWYVASTSKLLSPALRVAFVRAPGVAAALRLASDLHETAIMAPPINAALVSGWVLDGSFDRLVADMREEVRARRVIVAEELADLPYQAHPEGYHLWVPVPAGLTGRELAFALRGASIPVIAAERFAVDGAPDAAVRVSLGGLSGPDAIRRALRLLRGHLQGGERRREFMV